MPKRLHLFVRGRVQGVNFRWATQQQAIRHALTGWVRNVEDGSVEIVAEGSETDLKQFADWCRKGPPVARVQTIDVQEELFSGEFKSFEIRFN